MNVMKRHHDSVYQEDGDADAAKRPRHDLEVDIGQYRYLTVHRVDCTKHPGHGITFWADVPRLYASDSRATALHGQIEIKEDVYSEEFAYDNPDVSLIVTKSYDCGHYHDVQVGRGAFQTIEMPDVVADMLASYKAQLSLLAEDGPQASFKTETITYSSHDLRVAMTEVHKKYPQYFPEGALTMTLDAPYLVLYYARSTMESDILRASWLDESHREQVAQLMSYVLYSRSKEYEEAESQFTKGQVSRPHFFKLFAPDDILVEMTEDGPIALKIKRLPKTGRHVELVAWNWGFDGRFYKQEESRTVTWPSSDDTISMETLALYPLRFSNNDLRQRLYSRGETFWSCRNRRLVEWEYTATGFESRVVSYAVLTYSRSNYEC
jgi:hypothetical protein